LGLSIFYFKGSDPKPAAQKHETTVDNKDKSSEKITEKQDVAVFSDEKTDGTKKDAELRGEETDITDVEMDNDITEVLHDTGEKQNITRVDEVTEERILETKVEDETVTEMSEKNTETEITDENNPPDLKIMRKNTEACDTIL